MELGLLRSDYMVDAETGALLQIEINTIAASFAGLSTLVTRLHRHLADRHPASATRGERPDNGAVAGLARGLAAAWAEARLNPSPAAVAHRAVAHEASQTGSVSSGQLE